MGEDKFWVIKCKVCGKLHRGNPTMPGPGVFQIPMPIEGTVECPDNPGKRAEYWGSDWLALTQAEIDPLTG